MTKDLITKQDDPQEQLLRACGLIEEPSEPEGCK